MNYSLLMNTAVRAGEIMLCSGAETYRVEDTMYHILKNSQVETVEALVLMTGIMATLNDKDMEPITVMKRVHNRGTNLNKIVQVNDISRRFCGGEITLEETYEELGNIQGKIYSRLIYSIAIIGVAVGFAIFFGGTIIDVFATAVVGAFLALLILLGKKLGINIFIMDVLTSVGIAFMAVLLKQVLPIQNMDVIIISSIMPQVPGVAITNAIRDTLQGDYISGGARALEAFLKAAAIALGIGIGMAVFQSLLVGRGVL